MSSSPLLICFTAAGGDDEADIGLAPAPAVVPMLAAAQPSVAADGHAAAAPSPPSPPSTPVQALLALSGAAALEPVLGVAAPVGGVANVAGNIGAVAGAVAPVLAAPAHAAVVGNAVGSVAAARAAGTGGRVCERCNSNKGNAACKWKLCATCCAREPYRCHLTGHVKKKAKVAAGAPPPWFGLLEEAMEMQSVVFVKYSMGSRPHTVRPISPQHWIEKGVKFSAICCESHTEKTYYVGRIEHAQKTTFQ
jgi:hypothetical protein